MAEKTDWSFLGKKKFDNKEKKAEEVKPDRNIDELLQQQNQVLESDLKNVARLEYEKIKQETEKFRKEHGVYKSEEELKQEDLMLRKKFGIEIE